MTGSPPLRVAFAGTPPFAAASLQALHDAGMVVPLVLTQPDRPGGRGLKLQPSAVKRFALAHGLPLAQPRSLRLDGRWPDEARMAQTALQAAAADVLVVAAYGLILPRWTLEAARLGALNVHASLLPRWRGAAPIARAIEAGDAETGITLMQMDDGLDTGAMLVRAATPIGADDSSATLLDRLAALGAALLVPALRVLAAGRLPATPQPASGASYAHKIEKTEAALDWSQPAAVLARRVRAFDPFPGATFVHDGEVIKVWQARPVAGDAAPGSVLDAPPGELHVACGGGGALALLELQRPGGRRQPTAAFLQARPLPPGMRLAGPVAPG
ncbi:MAG: methionyl-tRNA formyltransferase [Rubrivivax sp.]